MIKIDFTENFNYAFKHKEKTILTCCVHLDRELMLDALKSNAIHIHGKYYRVPERRLLQALLHGESGMMEIDFEEIETA